MGMFNDLQDRAKLKAASAGVEDARKLEVKWLLNKTVEEILPEIEALGFVNVSFRKYDTLPNFTLIIQARRGYSERDFSFNMELGSLDTTINYGYGANSSKGKKIDFDYSWNNSKLVGIMRDALRALVADALNSLEFNKVKGWV